MQLIKDYMRDDTLRHALNELTRETFYFDFENWVTGGYYEGDYIPYSYEENGKLIANASANRMEFLQNGEVKHYIQIGTVMTRKDCRKQGYGRQLIEHIIEEYKDNCDGIYLYGNLDALGFYDKLGFKRGIQYRYTLKEDAAAKIKEQKKKEEGLVSKEVFCPAAGETHKARYQSMVRESAANSALEQINKFGLQLFYTADMEQIYYSEELDCYIAMEQQDTTLCLQSVTAAKRIPLEEILCRIPAEYDRLVLGFTPCKEDATLFDCEAYDGEEDYRFFFLGEALKSIETEKLYFPEFSHA